MRGLQVSLDQASIARCGPLPVWMVLGSVIWSGVANARQEDHERKVIMARIIDFYTPRNFSKKTAAAPQSGPAKVIMFNQRTAKSA